MQGNKRLSSTVSSSASRARGKGRVWNTNMWLVQQSVGELSARTRICTSSFRVVYVHFDMTTLFPRPEAPRHVSLSTWMANPTFLPLAVGRATIKEWQNFMLPRGARFGGHFFLSFLIFVIWKTSPQAR